MLPSTGLKLKLSFSNNNLSLRPALEQSTPIEVYDQECKAIDEDLYENMGSPRESFLGVLPQYTPAQTPNDTPISLDHFADDFVDVDADKEDIEFSALSIMGLFAMLDQSQEDVIMAQNGYKTIEKICDTLQGELFKAEVVKAGCIKDVGATVVIKKIDKDLADQGLAEDIDEDDDDLNMTYCVAEDIKKEAAILKHLTADNIPMGEYLVQYIDFFQSSGYYYLILEYIEGMNLKDFVDTAHKYIKDGKLSMKDYQKSIKYIFWQLSITLRFLHDIYHCCHLDLCLENIMLENVKFNQHKDGSVTLNNGISIKLCDFGVAEIFDLSKGTGFRCHKQELSVDNMHAPNVVNRDYYDARAADMWSLGLIFYTCLTGQILYKPEDMWQISENGYWALQNDALKQYIKCKNLTHCFKKDSFCLLNSLLCIDEMERITISKCIGHDYFRIYLKKYKNKINKKMIYDIHRLRKYAEKMINFPYYIDQVL